MPATTDKLSIPYPLTIDKVSDYPATAKSAAEKVESLLTVPTEVAIASIAGWAWAPGGGILRSVGAVHHLSIQIDRIAGGFSKEPNESVVIGAIPDTVPVPSANCIAGTINVGSVICNLYIGTDRQINVYADQQIEFPQGWTFRGHLIWIA